MKKCAMLTMDNTDGFMIYDQMLVEPMAKRGWEAIEVSWETSEANWDAFDLVLIRSTWNYQDDAQRFLAVLADIEASSARLENSLSVVKWNIAKTYLQELEAAGIGIVPTLWPKTFNQQDIEGYFSAFETAEIVFKPIVSANADDTYRISRDNLAQHLSQMRGIFQHKAFMVQPFIATILTEGEYSLFYFGGQYSHTINKRPKPKDFRVQEEHGGVLTRVEPEPALRKLAEQTLATIPYPCLYARVDFVRYQNSFALMEVELIEPSLYFNINAGAAARFTDAMVAWVA